MAGGRQVEEGEALGQLFQASMTHCGNPLSSSLFPSPGAHHKCPLRTLCVESALDLLSPPAVLYLCLQCLHSCVFLRLTLLILVLSSLCFNVPSFPQPVPSAIMSDFISSISQNAFWQLTERVPLSAACFIHVNGGGKRNCQSTTSFSLYF